MTTTTVSVTFAEIARELGAAARAEGWMVPSFRSPPRLVGVQRSLRRHAGGVTVAVATKGRPWGAVVADMVEGVVAANGFDSVHADRARATLWRVAGGVEAPTAELARPAHRAVA